MAASREIGMSKIKEIESRHKGVTTSLTGWSNEKCDEDGYRVPECSYLGDSLICLAHDYEGSNEDCLFLRNAHDDVGFLLGYVKKLKKRLRKSETEAEGMRKILSAMPFDYREML